MKRDTTFQVWGKLTALRNALVILAGILILTGCDTGQSNLKQAQQLLPGKWALIEQESLWYSDIQGKDVSESYSFTLDESPLTWIIDQEKIVSETYNWYAPQGTYQLQVNADEIYIVLNGAAPIQYGDTKDVIKLLQVNTKYLGVLTSSRNADGSTDRLYFQRVSGK